MLRTKQTHCLMMLTLGSAFPGSNGTKYHSTRVHFYHRKILLYLFWNTPPRSPVWCCQERDDEFGCGPGSGAAGSALSGSKAAGRGSHHHKKWNCLLCNVTDVQRFTLWQMTPLFSRELQRSTWNKTPTHFSQQSLWLEHCFCLQPAAKQPLPLLEQSACTGRRIEHYFTGWRHTFEA